MSVHSSLKNMGFLGAEGRLGQDGSRKLLVGLFFVVALLLRLWGLSRLGLWLDEGATVHFSEQSLLKILQDCFSHEPNPPLYYLAMHGWIRLFGDSEFVLRLPSAIFGAMTVSLIFLTGARFHSPRTGILAASLALSVPIQLQYSQEARSYALFSFLSLLAIYLTPLTIRSRIKVRFWILYIVETAMLFAHFFGALVVASQITYLFSKWATQETSKSEDKSLAQVGCILLAAIVTASPWYLAIFLGYSNFHQQVQWIEIYPHTNPLSFVESYFGLGRLWLNEWKTASWPILGSVIFLMILALWWFRVARGPKWSFKQFWLNFPPVALLMIWAALSLLVPWLLGMVGPRFFVLRYGLASASALYILTAAVFTVGSSQKFFWTVLTLLLAASVFQIHGYRSNFFKQDWRGAVTHIQNNDPALPIVVLPKRYMVQKYYEYSVVDYYASRLLTRDAGPISYINEPDELFKLPFASGPMWLIMIDWYNDDLMKNNSIWASLNITDQSRYESVLLMRVQGTK